MKANFEIVKFKSRDEWLAGRRGKITGTRAGEVFRRSGLTKEIIMTALGALGVEYDKKAKVDELEAMLPSDVKMGLLVALPKKMGYYELIAERLATEPDSGESAMDRGSRLEAEAITRFITETGKKVDANLVILQRKDNPSIAYSPDGFIGSDEDVEVKCLSSARHIEAFLTGKIPDEYWSQVIQGFVVNDTLKKRSIVFYDPRIAVKDYFVIEVSRADVQKEVEEYLTFERLMLERVNDVVNELTF